jgi:hypothetical protein
VTVPVVRTVCAVALETRVSPVMFVTRVGASGSFRCAVDGYAGSSRARNERVDKLRFWAGVEEEESEGAAAKLAVAMPRDFLLDTSFSGVAVRNLTSSHTGL